MIGLRTRLSVLAGYMPQKRSNDSFIVAHPRSGSTWLRTIITNILIPEAQSDPDVFNDLIPGFSIRRARELSKLRSPRLLMTHSAYLPGFPRVLYLVRDGRDVLISYYNFLVYRKQRVTADGDEGSIDFSTFLARYYDGRYGHIWDHHVQSWLVHGPARMGVRIMIVKFEDMKISTEEVVQQIVAFLSIPATDDEISRAVQDASIEKARKVEKEEWKKKGLGAPDSRSSFYGSGAKRDWRKHFSDEDMELFLKHSTKALELVGYPLREQTI